MAQVFALSHGASWVLPDGRVIKIPGFHSSWLASHAGISGGTTNTADFVRKSGWISAVLHEKGYLELIVRSTDDEKSRDCLWNLLATNRGELERVVLMVLGREGMYDFAPVDFADRDKLFTALETAPLPQA